jgi:uncharacterized protein
VQRETRRTIAAVSDDSIPPAEHDIKDRPQGAGWGIETVFVGLLLLLVVSFLIDSLYTAIAGAKSDDAATTLGELLVGLAGPWVAFFGASAYAAWGRPGSWSGQLGLKFSLPNDLLAGFSLGVLGQVMVAVIYLPVRLISSKAANSVSNVAKNDTAAAHGWRWIPVGICIALIAPVAEELFFRGVTLRAFTRKLGPLAGIFFSGLIFGLAHFEGIQTPALVVFGWILGWYATRTGRIGPTIFAHMTFNGITLAALALS